MVYRNLYMDKIIPFIDTPFIKILTGIRRSGKSTILNMIKEELLQRGVKEEQILSYRFDSPVYEDITTSKALYTEIKSHLYPNGRTYIFLDEIQEVQDWEKAVNSFMQDFDADVYVTGSNSRMMSSEIETYLTGRYISFRVYPLTFAEYLAFRKDYTKADEPHQEFARYLRFGGFPALHLREYTEEEAYNIVYDIYNATIFTDIVKRNQIRKADQLERIVKFVFDNVGQTFSALSVSKYMKSQGRSLDSETVYNYLDKLERAYIIDRCPRYDIRGKELLKTQEKFYLADSALRYAVLGYDPNCIPAMMENAVFLELKSRGYRVTVGKLDNAEIDFVAEKQDKKLYVQVTYQINSPETQKREYNRLLSIADNYPKYVVRMDDLAGGNYEGIQTMHIADFLLSREY